MIINSLFHIIGLKMEKFSNLCTKKFCSVMTNHVFAKAFFELFKKIPYPNSVTVPFQLFLVNRTPKHATP
jgi:hypothetical protein